MSTTEVIDVDAFHNDLWRIKQIDTLERKNYHLKEDNKRLENKTKSLDRNHNELCKQMFEEKKRQTELALILGFDDIEEACQNITKDDPWVPGANTALTNARSRILELEDELAKHVVTGKEAQTLLEELSEKLLSTRQDLDNALANSTRLREERDHARWEAEKHAEDAQIWRNELQTKLPEMQSLMKELQKGRLVTTKSVASSIEKENVDPESIHTSIFNEAKNVNLSKTANPPPSTEIITPDTIGYKKRFERLEQQYQALLDAKTRISAQYREDIKRWKNMKEFFLGDNQKGSIPGTHRRVIRRRKIKEEPEAKEEPIATQHIQAHISISNIPTTDADMHSADEILPQRMGVVENRPLKDVPLRFLSKTSVRSLSPQHFEESLTQPSSVPVPSGVIDVDNKNISATQESVTEPSSSSPPSHNARQNYDSPLIMKKSSSSRVLVVDSSPERGLKAVGHDNDCDGMTEIEITPSSNLQGKGPRMASLHRSTYDVHYEPPFTVPKPLQELALSKQFQPNTETPTSYKYKTPVFSGINTIKRNVSTVLVPDTPPATKVVVRHSSSPPDSPHMQRLNKGKRKAVELTEADNESETNPFQASPSRLRSNPAVQTQKDKGSHIGSLKKKTHEEYMAKYMPFKGRGRYSNVKGAANKTINSEFEIDPEKNRGLNFQYEAVVRDRAERKRLETSDCECCREYYEAVGPLPPGLQAPLWRSPPSEQSQNRARPCRYKKLDTDADPLSSPPTKARKRAIEVHKNEISRHRHDWAPPTTPPDFWKIGFPDTQEVEEINRRADDMHTRKFKRVEAQAQTSTGRYRKRT